MINEQKRGKEATRALRLETIRPLFLIICFAHLLTVINGLLHISSHWLNTHVQNSHMVSSRNAGSLYLIIHFAVLYTKDAFSLGYVFIFGSYVLRSKSLWRQLFRFCLYASFDFASASDRLGNGNLSLRCG